MCHKCYHAFLAALIIIFSFWKTDFSMGIIIVSAGIIFLWEVYLLFMLGCEDMCFGERKTGSELIMEKSQEIKSKPTKKEVKKVMKRK